MSEVGTSPADLLRAQRALRERQEEAERHTQANLEALETVHATLDLGVVNRTVAELESGTRFSTQPFGRERLSFFVDDLRDSLQPGYRLKANLAKDFAKIAESTGDPDADTRTYNTAGLLAGSYARAVFEVLMVTQRPVDKAEHQAAAELSAKIAELQQQALVNILDSANRPDVDKNRVRDWQTATASVLQKDRRDLDHNLNLRLVAAAAAEMHQTKARLAKGYIKRFSLAADLSDTKDPEQSWAQKFESREKQQLPRKLIGGLGTLAVLGGIATSGGPEKVFYGGALLTETAALAGAQLVAQRAIDAFARQAARDRDHRQTLELNTKLAEIGRETETNLIDHEGGLMSTIANQLANAQLGKNLMEALFSGDIGEYQKRPDRTEEQDERAKEIKKRARIRSIVAAGAMAVTATVAGIDAFAIKDRAPDQKDNPDTVPVITADTSVEAGNAEDCRLLGASGTTIVINGQRTSCP